MPKVSVIIPIWNAEKYLPECLDKICRQTLSDIEIICVDDGSNDRTGEILARAKAMDSRIKVLWQENAGAGAARNAGMDVATGEYICFFDPDDWCDLDTLEVYYNKCVLCNADLLIAPLTKFDSTTGADLGVMKFPKFLAPYQSGTGVLSPEEMGSNVFTAGGNGPCNKLFRRAVATDNAIRFQPLRRTNDLYFVKIFIANSQRIAFSDRACYHYRKGISSATTRDKLSDSFCSALEAVHDRLVADGMFQKFASAFGRLTIGSFVFNLKSIKNRDSLLKWYAGVRPRIIALMSAVSASSDIVLYRQERAIYTAVVASEDVDVVIREMNRQSSLPMRSAARLEREMQSVPLIGKALGGIKCVLENGIKYTIKHVARKVLRGSHP